MPCGDTWQWKRSYLDVGLQEECEDLRVEFRETLENERGQFTSPFTGETEDCCASSEAG